jgi:type II secretory pathway component PulF
MHFEYTAKSNSGKTLSGVLSAGAVDEVRRLLRQQNLFPLTIRQAGRGKRRSGPFFRWPRSRISKQDLMTFTSQLAIMCRAGIDLASALDNISQQCPHPRLKETLRQIHTDVLSGKSVSAALKSYEHVFGASYIASVASAEASGRLPEVLKRLAALLRNELQMRHTLRTLMAYPILLTCVSAIVVVILTFFVLPQFSLVFEQMDITVPATTAILVGAANAVRQHWWLWLGIAAAAVVAGSMFIFSRPGRRWIDWLSLNLIVIRDVTRALIIGRTLRQLGMMVDSGVPLLDGLRLTKSAIRNSLVADFYSKLETEIVNGRGLGSSFLACPFVPPGAAQMVATAEQTGTLAVVTQMVGEFFEEQGQTRLREVATILEPVIIVIMGIVVAFVVSSVMLPIFDFAATPQ